PKYQRTAAGLSLDENHQPHQQNERLDERASDKRRVLNASRSARIAADRINSRRHDLSLAERAAESSNTETNDREPEAHAHPAGVSRSILSKRNICSEQHSNSQQNSSTQKTHLPSPYIRACD